MTLPTLEEIYSKCEPYGDCQLWTGCLVYEGGQPRMYDGKKPLSGRRVVFELARGEIRPGMRIWMRCLEQRCLNPDHMQQLGYSDMLKAHHKRNGGKFPPSHVATLTASARKRPTVKLTMEDARAARESEEPASVVAKRLGVNKSLICKIRRNEIWSETTRGSSVFSLA